jgi:TetR/AcrR family transcriptional regulator, transcriptional repressor of bet genes
MFYLSGKVLSMPARTDHQLRRDEVARIAADLIATGGLAAATHRNIAQAAGCSTTLVSHYFTDKRDLVLATYRHVGDRVSQRLDEAAAHRSRPLLRTLEALLPLDPDRIRDWRLLFAFLGMAATDPQLASEQQARLRSAREHVERFLDHSTQLSGPRSDSAATATELLAVVLGLGMQALFDPDAWPAHRLRRTLLDELHLRGLD